MPVNPRAACRYIAVIESSSKTRTVTPPWSRNKLAVRWQISTRIRTGNRHDQVRYEPTGIWVRSVDSTNARFCEPCGQVPFSGSTQPAPARLQPGIIRSSEYFSARVASRSTFIELEREGPQTVAQRGQRLVVGYVKCDIVYPI
jgi:hypothetical protein